MDQGGVSRALSLSVVGLFVCWATLCTVSSKKVMQEVVASSNFLFFLQGVVSVVVLQGLVHIGAIDKSVVAVEPGNKRALWIAVAYTANVAFGLCSLYYVSLPMFGALKRLTILACWVGEWHLYRNSSTLNCVLPLTVMVLGTLVAGWHDLEFSPLGYIFGVASSAGQGVAFVLSKTLKGPADKPYSLPTVMHVVYFNSLVSTVMMSCVVSFTGWGDVLREGKDHLGVWDMGQLAANTILILLLNIVIFLDCTVNTPLTHAVAGNLKAAATTLAGIAVFGTTINMLGGVGLALNLAGGAWYSYVRTTALDKKQDTADDDDRV